MKLTKDRSRFPPHGHVDTHHGFSIACLQLGHPRNTIPILANEGRSNACGRGIIKKKGRPRSAQERYWRTRPIPSTPTPTTAHILAPAQRLERRNSSTGTFIDRSRSEAHPEHLGKTEQNHEDEIHCTFISIPGSGQCDADQNGSS